MPADLGARLTHMQGWVSLARIGSGIGMSTNKTNIPDFEKALSELESLVEKMEQGELTLEQSLQHFERGVALTRTCQQALEQAQFKFDQLTDAEESDASGTPDDESA